MSIDYSALLGLAAGIQVAKGDYDFARDGGTVGVHTINSPTLPTDALLIGWAARTTLALTYGGAGSVNISMEGIGIGAVADALGGLIVDWFSPTPAIVLTAERPIQMEVYDFPLLTGSFDCWVFYLPT